MDTQPNYNALHEKLDDAVRRNAEAIVPHLLELTSPESVIDIGCGSGIWLNAFNMKSIRGLDGDYIDRGTLKIPEDRFTPTDLSKPFDAAPHDLAICLEVGEHLPEASADALVDSIVKAAPAVFFSAAIPGQGGVGHINEQWPSWWKKKFEARGFVAFDTLRRKVWDDSRVLYWYAQNALLYVRQDSLDRYPKLKNEPGEFLADVIHPNRYLVLDRSARAGEAPGLGFLLKSVPGALSRFVKARLGKPAAMREPSRR